MSKRKLEELDFLFIYEHKVRELENLCLMKYELDRRGYRTKIVYINSAQNAFAVKPIYHTKVLCMMACYNNHTLRWHTKDFVKFDKIIDLQWENIVYPKDENREGAFKNYAEIGKEVVRVSWGRQNQKRLLEAAHMDPRKVKLTGHVGMDFLREPLSRYYLSREALFEKYQIPVEKRVVLFASPYYGDALEQDYIDDMCSRFGDDWINYYEFMCASQKIVLDWMERLCKEDPELVIVFRPHPGHPSTMAQELEKRCSNFRIIAGESVKQWIVTCDKVYTGNSSVVVEAFFAQKMCQLLFPLPVTEGYRLQLLEGAEKITDLEQFATSVYAQTEKFPVPRTNIEDIYLIDWETPNYIKFADMAEEVLHDDYYKLPDKLLKTYKNYDITTRVIKAVSRITPLYRIYQAMLENDKLKWSYLEKQRQNRQKYIQYEMNDAHEIAKPEEIEEIIHKIENAIEN